MGERLKHITEMVCRLLRGEGTAEERVRWSREVEEARCGEVVKRLEDEGYVERRLQGYGRWNEREGFRRFVAAVERIRRQRRMWRRLAWVGVAAGVACVMCVGILLRKEEPVVVAAKPVNEVIAPGSTKATLRLAGGETVHITGDTMHIARTEESQIRYEDGKLMYASGRKAAELVYNELEVPVAGECSLVLDDGTQVWVNADSRLRYPVQFVGEERKVFLEGEAFFEVAKSEEKPFVVDTRELQVVVTGTKFDVKAYEEEETVSATLVEGGVKVRATGAGGENGIKELKPSQQYVLDVQSHRAEVREVDVQLYTGWVDGMFVFKNQRLEEVMTMLARWYSVDVFYVGESVKDIRLSAYLGRYEHIDSVLDVIRATNKIDFVRKGNVVTVMKK